MQSQFIFFPQESVPPTPEARRNWLTPDNPTSPYHGFIGNRRAVSKLIRIDFDMLGNYNHLCRELSIALVGPAGSGKTSLAKRHAQANRLPLVEVSPRAVKTSQDVFALIQRTCEGAGLPLVELRPSFFKCPPINVFIDEVHALPGSVVQGLLKAVEYKDCMLATEKGLVMDTFNVHWIIATTDRGKLFDAFDTRFMKIIINLYTKEDIAKIVRTNHDLPEDVCHLVAHYCSRVPREALAFAREMLLEFNMQPAPWSEVAGKVAEDNGIDPFGMTYQRVAILKALGQGRIAEKRVSTVVGCKPEELERFIMPWLVEGTEDQPPLVFMTPRGYQITAAGLEELDKRKIAHKSTDCAA